jgi:hypothetical protein
MHTRRSGAIAVMIVLIVGAAAIIVASSSLLLSMGDIDEGYTAQRGSEALAVADGCIEETTRRSRLDENYGIGAGTINLTVSNGSCTIDVSDIGTSPEKRRVDVTGTSGVYHRKLRAEYTLTTDTRPVVSVTSWEELTD